MREGGSPSPRVCKDDSDEEEEEYSDFLVEDSKAQHYSIQELLIDEDSNARGSNY
jgi:hypothetical protein